MKSAEKTSKDLKSKDTTVVFKLQHEKRESCRHSDRTNHEPSECRFREATCYSCGRRGYISPAKKSPRPFLRKTSRQFQIERKVKKVHGSEQG